MEYLNTIQAAAYIKVSTSTLRKWRLKGSTKGPKFKRAGDKIVVYKKSDLDDFINGGNDER